MDILTIKRFYKEFPDEAACLRYLERLRWPDNPICPHCSQSGGYRFADGKLFKCPACLKQFTVKTGTILSDSHIPMQDWFQAVYILCDTDVGISSVQLADYLELTQKSAWSLVNRIRQAMTSGGSVKTRRVTEGKREKPYMIDMEFDEAMRTVSTARKTDT
jgi:transposase-like protein